MCARESTADVQCNDNVPPYTSPHPLSPPAELTRCLSAVDLDYLLARGAGWDATQPWAETLSGGEKQRLAMARLLFHRPAYAVLDECTSAVRVGEATANVAVCGSSSVNVVVGARTLKRPQPA